MASVGISSPPCLMSSEKQPLSDDLVEPQSSPSSQGGADVPVTPPQTLDHLHDGPRYPQPAEL